MVYERIKSVFCTNDGVPAELERMDFILRKICFTGDYFGVLFFTCFLKVFHPTLFSCLKQVVKIFNFLNKSGPNKKQLFAKLVLILAFS